MDEFYSARLFNQRQIKALMARNTKGHGGGIEEKMPMYEKIAGELHKKILSGDYNVGSKLPVEKELCEQFEVSRHTIREALRLLRQEGLISSNKKAGTIVEPFPAPTSTFLHAQSVDDLLTFSYRWIFTITAIEMSPLPKAFQRLAGDSGDWLKIAGKARFEDSGEPECWFENYVHPDYVEVKEHLTPTAEPLLPLIEKVCKVVVVELDQEASAIALPRKVATALHAKNDTIAMSVRRTGYLLGGKIAFFTNEIYPASRFKYRFSLNRRGANQP